MCSAAGVCLKLAFQYKVGGGTAQHKEYQATYDCCNDVGRGGEECPGWEDNLALAQKLRNALNDSYENLCRPTSLKPSTYNQEFSKHSLLLEIGTSGNSLEEAKISAELVAKAIAELLK